MSQIQTIESQDLSIGKLLDDFYVVPDYQREYVWEEGEVEQLLEDVYAEFSNDHTSARSEYFVGSIVVCPSRDGEGVLELIDGQQRCTTIYIALCALRDHLSGTGAEPISALAPQIAASDIDAEGNDVFRYRVDLQYTDSAGILKSIAKGEDFIGVHEDPTRSVANIVNAYRVARGFLAENCADAQTTKRFYAYLTQRVKLIRIQTKSVAHALKIFETINDRGKGLDSMDLLKNLMFMSAKSREFDELKDKWKDLIDLLYGSKEKPLRFLRYFIFATYDVDRLKEDEIYAWFVEKKSLCGYESHPVRFVEQLLNAARAYTNFVDGKDAQGRPNRYLANLQLLSGAARQHLILLLAARSLSSEAFADLCKNVENLFFTYIITRENTREFERRFANWAQSLRNVRTEGALDAFLQEHFEPAKGNLATRFDLTFENLSADSIQKYRMRYLLGKLTQYVNEEAFGSTSSTTDLRTFVNPKVHVEHVLPQTAQPEVLLEFDAPSEISEFVPMLGNLVLAERPINTSLGNRPFSHKRTVYPQSTFLLTQSLSKKIEVGTNTSVDRAVKDLEPYETWTTESIRRRQRTLRDLARRVWEVPEASGKEIRV